MVHFPALPSHSYEFRVRSSGINQSGLPHSEIPGSKPACGSPGLIAACHVLHRLLAPRHSPYALSSLTKFSLTHCACVIKELPIAGYSVVKDLLAELRLPQPTVNSNTRARLRSLPELRRATFDDSPRGLPTEARFSLVVHLRSLRAMVDLACHPQLVVYALRGPTFAKATVGILRVNRERRMVENTGLEPVTSWLQTRRSPS